MNTKHLKAKILDLAIRGKLVPQDSSEGNAADLLQKIREEKSELVKQKKIKEDKNSSFIIKAEDGKHYEQFADGSLKDIEDEIPFEIPENWCWCRLRNIGNYKKGPFGSALTKSMFVPKSETTVKVYEQQNAIKKNHELGHYYIKGEYFESDMKGFEVHPGDILVSCAGTIGETYILPDDIEKGIINQALMKMTITKKINIQYFLMYFDHILKSASDESGKGTAMKNIPPFDVFKQFLFPLPPLSEQKRIVSAIEKAFEQIDIIEKNKLNLKTYIKQTKSKVLDLAIHGKLVEQNPQEGNAFELLEKIRNEKAELIKQKKLKEDKNASFIIKADNGKHYGQFADGSLKDVEEEIPFEIPENWCWCRLPELCLKISDGTHKTPTYVDSGIPFLSVQNISKGYFDLNVIKYITPEEHNKLCQRIKPQKDDILICRIGTLGRAIRNILDFEFSIFVSLGLIRLMNTDFVDFVIATLNSNYGTGWINDNKVQGSHTNKINLETFPKLFIPLPPAEEQKRIIRRVEQVFEQLDILEKSLGE